MGTHYQQLSISERCEIARLRDAGHSKRQIAAALDRAPSTIARELDRNASATATAGYQPEYAHQQAQARCWRGARLERGAALREAVLSALGAGWSPAQVSGRLALEYGRPVISHESIYRFIYAQLARTKDYSWRLYLRRGKSKRGWRGRRGGNTIVRIPEWAPLSQRSPEANDRGTPGHWEADLMLFGNHGPVLLLLHERHSRLLLACRLPGKAAPPIAAAIARMLSPLPPELRRSVAFDNGTEFARHSRLHKLGIRTYFCEVRSPWQKGGVENAIGRLRRFLPRRTNLKQIRAAELTAVLQAYNNTPRQCLGYRTPAEVFADAALHLKCEFTFRLAPE